MSGKTDVWMRNCENREASFPTPLFLCGVSSHADLFSVYVTDTSPQSIIPSFYLVKHHEYKYLNRSWGRRVLCRVVSP